MVIPALNIAANNHHVDCMKELLKAGTELNGTHKAGNTALIDAAGNGHVNCVKELVEAECRCECYRTVKVSQP